jgi:hypothetical protein
MERADLGASGFVRAEGSDRDAVSPKSNVQGPRPSDSALTPALSHPKRTGEGEEWDGTQWSRRDGTLTFNIRGAPQTGPTEQSPTGQCRSVEWRSGPAIGTGLIQTSGTGHVRDPVPTINQERS